ncbi:MAG TPA: VanW family protein [Mobilitalea sp.]|nr:VanW family protein [Mobilitalea sp.]
MSRRRICLSATLFLSIFLTFMGRAFYASAEENDNRICRGVFIDEVEISGMTETEAQSAVDAFAEKLRGKGIAIQVGDNTVFTTLGELGYTYEPNDNIKQALALGTAGNLIKRYKDIKDIEQGNVIYPLNFTIDEDSIMRLVEEKASIYNVAPVNATVTRKQGEFVYTDHILGSKVEVAATAEVILNTVINNWNRMDIVVNAVMVDDVPIYTRDVVEKCNTILGVFTTEYASSAEGRAANLANGAKLINNTVLYPGEIFSGYEYLTPFTVDNGYYQAGAYSQGKVIDSIGGGACQVTTTLYNAVLLAELEVVERQAHSMTISYVELSRDAAIAGTYKDLKFQNNTDVPILIQATTKDRRITFTIWGNETRDTVKRRVEYVTVEVSKTEPPKDVIDKDPTKPTTYRRVTQSAHVGYKAELYKVVYENDVEVSRSLVNKSSYNAAPRYVTVGTKPVEEVPIEDKDKKDPIADQNENVTEQEDNQTTIEQSQNEEQIVDDLESQSVPQENKTNPEGQLQGETYWDSELIKEALQEE